MVLRSNAPKKFQSGTRMLGSSHRPNHLQDQPGIHETRSVRGVGVTVVRVIKIGDLSPDIARRKLFSGKITA